MVMRTEEHRPVLRRIRNLVCDALIAVSIATDQHCHGDGRGELRRATAGHRNYPPEAALGRAAHGGVASY